MRREERRDPFRGCDRRARQAGIWRGPPRTLAYPRACERRLRRARDARRAKGCARVFCFIRPGARAALEAEVDAIADNAHSSQGRITPYFNADEPHLQPGNPCRRVADFSNGFVAMDWFPADGPCLSPYHDPGFQRFVADCLEALELHVFDVPLAGVVAKIMPEGSALPGRYDTNEFIVGPLTRKPESGGAFEYCPNLRAPCDER